MYGLRWKITCTRRAEETSEKDKAEPEKKWTAERNKSIKQSAELETKRTEKYQGEPEKKRVAKRQRYWKGSEHSCLADRVLYGEPKYTLERHRKSTTDKVTRRRYVVHVHVPLPLILLLSNV